MFEIIMIKIYRMLFFTLKKVYLYVSKKVVFHIRAYADRKSVFEGNNNLGMDTFLSDTVLGYGSYVSDFSKIFNTKIGRFTSIGQNVCTAIGKHPLSENISTSPSFFSINPRNRLRLVEEQTFDEYVFLEGSKYSIEIGNDVWIGNNVVILQGVKIADGAIIGAGAVVTKDVEPYAICIGNPAKCIRYRFEQEEIEKLLQIKWWNREVEWLRAHAKEFHDKEKFFCMNEREGNEQN